jgi:tetratricopeptide (TPR) repeat protein
VVRVCRQRAPAYTRLDLVAQTYNETGLAQHKQGNYTKSAAYFSKAAAVLPKTSLFHYNLASAFARLGDARTEPTLKTAISLGGRGVRLRAEKDPDFEGVKDAAWFRAL